MATEFNAGTTDLEILEAKARKGQQQPLQSVQPEQPKETAVEEIDKGGDGFGYNNTATSQSIPNAINTFVKPTIHLPPTETPNEENN